MKSLRLQLGMSLIELMVAMVIAALLGIGLVQIFGGTRAAFNTNSALARAQENARFAIGFIESDLKMAGHMGSRNEIESPPGESEVSVSKLFFNHLATTTNRRPDGAKWAYRLDIPFQSYEYVGTGMNEDYEISDELEKAEAASEWSPALPDDLWAEIGSNVLKGSDIFVVRHLSPEFVTLVNTRTRPDGYAVSANLPLNLTDGTFYWRSVEYPNFVESGGIYSFSNGKSLNLFQVTDVTGDGDEKSAVAAGGLNGLNWMDELAHGQTGEVEPVSEYGGMVPVHRYHLAVYYVREGADGNASLYRKRLDPSKTNGLSDAEEMVPGVESIQITLGVINTVGNRISDQPGAYLTSDLVAVGDWGTTEADRWRRVVSARVGLLMRSLQRGSEAEITGENSQGCEGYSLNGLCMKPDGEDRQLRYTYETHVSFRNRSRG